ncbi:hypothetical protein BZG36_04503 [Bifiguratus adelaidae]|uniref:SEC7 domain-containing protein n=1 Tax=Bifiguratus adelaidae TaxID=1938954 RepID=A0A261XW36_9FUNG|nr:hypothetical protein BZG36_04503 [Bifiguratus adelaidae]
MQSVDTPLKSELDWRTLVHAEIISTTSVMRKNSRWSGMSVSALSMGGLGMSMGLRGNLAEKSTNYRNQESPLMNSFTTLRAYLTSLQRIEDLDAHLLLTPFLDVIRTGDTTGPITGAALTSVERFLQYGIINGHSNGLPHAMAALSSAATHCKFEASDSVSDEVVLLRILQLLERTLTSDCGKVLSDEAVCEMMETGLSMCCQMRLSEMLRRSAEHVMINMTLQVDMDNDSTPTEGMNGETKEADLHMQAPNSVSTPMDPLGTSTETSSILTETANADNDIVKSDEIPAKDTLQAPKDTTTTVSPSLKPDNDITDISGTSSKTTEPPRPYGLPAIRELLRVLISLLNPHDHQHTDSMRLMALSILNVAFDVAGESISRFEVLRQLVADDFCKYLFQLARSDVIPLLTLTLRVISSVFNTMQSHLKLQQELFLQFLMERLTPPSVGRSLPFNLDREGNLVLNNPLEQQILKERSNSPNPSGSPRTDSRQSTRGQDTPASGEVKELLLECLAQCARRSMFMVDLWVNYDCNLECSNLFQELVRFLSRNAYVEPQTYTSSNAHILCLDTLLMLIGHMVERCDRDDSATADPTPENLLKMKAHKQLLLEGVAKFNENSKEGLKFLSEHSLIASDPASDNYASLVHFLHTTPRLNKKALGDFLSKPNNLPILREYMKVFDFTDRRVDEALREMLEAFRLPGEAQQIERIVETFSEVYFATSPLQVASKDGAYVLSYSVILLNTDQHNPQNRHRMTLQDYNKILKGVNGGNDFPADYIQAIYNAIRKREIVMPEEHEGQVGFNYAWKELLRRAETAGPYVHCYTSAYDREIFQQAWKPAFMAIVFAFTNAQDDVTLQKAISGFHQCALISAHYGLHDIFDVIVKTLSGLTGLLEATRSNQGVADAVVEVSNQKYVVSDLAIQFGRDYKGQLAAVVAFAVAIEYGNHLRDSWKNILLMIKNLFINSLLPSSMVQVEDFLSGTTSIPLRPKTVASPKNHGRRDGSLLSALSSYLLSPYSGDESYRPAPTDEEVESTLCAADCVVACRLEELFADIRVLEEAPLEALMKAIRVVGVPRKVHHPTPVNFPQPGLQAPSMAANTYDPAIVFFLELMISVTIQNRDRIERLWPYVFDHLRELLNKPEESSDLLVERTVVGLLRLCIRLIHKREMQQEVFSCLQLLVDFPPQVTQSVAEQMMAGVSSLIRMEETDLSDPAKWKAISTLIKATASHPNASKYSFECIELTLSPSAAIEPQNFAGILNVLEKFVSIGGNHAETLANSNNYAHEGKRLNPYLMRAKKAIELVYGLNSRISELEQQDETVDGWQGYWIPLAQVLARQSCNAAREIRQHAITYLQRLLLLPQLTQSTQPQQLFDIFDKVVFPLLDELRRPEMTKLDPNGSMDEARMRSLALLCKIFLHYNPKLASCDGYNELWSKILDTLSKYAAPKESDHLSEAVNESLKNMLLVMYTSGAFTEPSEGGETNYTNLWTITWDKVNAFLPNLQGELFPDSVKPTKPAEKVEEKSEASAESAPVEGAAANST